MQTSVQKIEPASTTLRDALGKTQTIPNDVVFTMLGREAPPGFFSGVPGFRFAGSGRRRQWLSFLAFFAFARCLHLESQQPSEPGFPAAALVSL